MESAFLKRFHSFSSHEIVMENQIEIFYFVTIFSVSMAEIANFLSVSSQSKGETGKDAGKSYFLKES